MFLYTCAVHLETAPWARPKEIEMRHRNLLLCHCCGDVDLGPMLLSKTETQLKPVPPTPLIQAARTERSEHAACIWQLVAALAPVTGWVRQAQLNPVVN